uniref:WSC domain-containing protein n=2 Tax=Macrostomum lignano TaxID=282301 RepID=A0A1I8I814_9PLAT
VKNPYLQSGAIKGPAHIGNPKCHSALFKLIKIYSTFTLSAPSFAWLWQHQLQFLFPSFANINNTSSSSAAVLRIRVRQWLLKLLAGDEIASAVDINYGIVVDTVRPASEQPVPDHQLQPVPDHQLQPVPDHQLQPVPDHQLQPVPDHQLQPVPDHQLQPVPDHQLQPEFPSGVETANFVSQCIAMMTETSGCSLARLYAPSTFFEHKPDDDESKVSDQDRQVYPFLLDDSTDQNSVDYREIEGPFYLSPLISTEVINISGVKNVNNCMMLCRIKGCSVIVAMTTTSTVCRLLILKGISLSNTILDSPSAVGSEAGSQVLVNADINATLAAMINNETFTWLNSSTGRIGSIQLVNITLTGCYRIEVAGARGGDNIYRFTVGGNGSWIAGSFNLTAGTQLAIVVGQAGGSVHSYDTRDCGSGGGGGSFVYEIADEHLLIAAGGGGGSSRGKNALPGEDTVNGSDSVAKLPDTIGFGGVNGHPGYNEPWRTGDRGTHGGCGAGWLGSAVNPRRNSSDGERGGGLADDWVGGEAGIGGTGDGGFGGGGGGGGMELDGSKNGAGGGGGGFSGGGAGVGGSNSGGGGGSFCGGSDCSAIAGGNSFSEHGFVVLRMQALFADKCN